MDLHNRNLIGVCGLYCGACYHYHAAFPEGAHLRPLPSHAQADFTCLGCRSEKRYMHPGCAACELRACAESRGCLHCGDCEVYPCPQLLAFRDDGRLHHRDIQENLALLQANDPETWLDLQAQRWTCACGAPFSWYESRCPQCHAPVSSYGPDPTGRAPRSSEA